MDKLTEIMERKRRDIANSIRPVRDHELTRFCPGEHPRRLERALRRETGLSVIAEIKRRSPSAGAIAETVEAAEQARIYYNAGTDAISVLTDTPYFGGSIRDLWDVTDLLGSRSDAPPILRKDFFIEPIQVLEAAEAGASVILIIVRALTDEQIQRLYAAANIAGLDAIFEVHTLAELERALKHNSRIVGVNNRDLTRFVTDLAISETLIPQIPEGCIRISESGIHSLQDAQRAWDCGSDAVLVGESLMKSEDPESFIAAMHTLG
jgi:indole-3-glycerol phosphate synthase